MRVVVTPEVGNFVRERGGRLFVWANRQRCCGGGVTFLSTASQAPQGHAFQVVGVEGFDLFFDSGRSDPPSELQLEVRGRRHKRVEAYWDGCVFAG